MTEAQLQSAVIDLAHLYGYMVAHFRPAMNTRGQWMTPVQADGAGWPDLSMVRGPRLIFAELKGDNGRIDAKQQTWLDALRNTTEVYLWRPADWTSGRIDTILKPD